MHWAAKFMHLAAFFSFVEEHVPKKNSYGQALVFIGIYYLKNISKVLVGHASTPSAKINGKFCKIRKAWSDANFARRPRGNVMLLYLPRAHLEGRA